MLDVSLTGKAAGLRADRRRRPRPARLDPRPPPHRRRHPLRRRRRHGDEARAVGRGARRPASPAASGVGPTLLVPTPSGTPVHPGARPRARRPRPPRRRLRPLRRHRPARPRRGCHDVRRPRGLARRLRAQRRRGRRRRRSSRRSSDCCPASWATPTRWSRSPTRTACSSTPSTPSPPPGAAARCPPVLLSGDHARDRRLAARRVRTPYRRPPPRPRHPAARSALADATSRSGPPTRADAGELFTLTRACWLQEQWANPGVVDPGARGVVRRRRAGPRGLDDAGRPGGQAGSSARPAAGSTGDGDGVGHRPGDGRARPAGPWARAACCSTVIEAARRPR